MAQEDRRPNILMILNDQHRYDTLGCYGAPICRTPHLDSLAARGVRFDRAYTATSPCSPSRAALFTGLYPHKNGVPVNGCDLNRDVPSLATEMGAAGYQLGYAGKWHVDEARVPTEHGFQGIDFPGYGYPPVGGSMEGLRFMQRVPMPDHYARYLDERGLGRPKVMEALFGSNPGQPGHEVYALHSGDIESSFETMAAEHAIALIKQFKANQDQGGAPFCLWVNFWGPHTPCLIPEPYYSMYDPKSIPMEPSFAETFDRKPGVQRMFEKFWGLREGGWEVWSQIIARYWGYVTMIDDLIGRMLGVLSELGLEQDTMVAFSTDHGDMMGAHRLIEKGPFTYEQCYRLPMVIAHPDCQAPGSACDEFVYLHDLFATCIDAAGRTPPEVPDGQSILPQALGQGTPTDRESAYCVFEDQVFPFQQRMVRTRTHKLVYNRSDMGELYDMVNDPWEMHNLVDMPEMASVQQELLERLRAHMVRLDDPVLPAFDRVRHVF